MSTFSASEQQKLRELVNEGIAMAERHKLEKQGLAESIKAVSEELGLKPKAVRKAIACGVKNSLHEEEEVVDEVRDILHASGRG